MELKAPWLKFYDGIRQNLSYPDATISEVVFDMAEEYPKNTALVFMGRKISYCEFKEKVLRVQQMLENIGIKKGDRLMACLPNIPQAVYLLYAADRMGAVCSFVHPLSAVGELAKYIEELEAVCVVGLDSMESKLTQAMSLAGERLLVLTSVVSEAGSIYKFLKKKSKVRDRSYLQWENLILTNCKESPTISGKNADDTAVILFSGGTTGEPKGVMLSGKGLNAMAMQTAQMSGCEIPGRSMLAAMPIFHGFGLCVCVHAVLMHGGTCILVPKFESGKYAVLIKKYRPNFIAGVPTLFEALMKEPRMKKLDLSSLLGVFSGGDALPEKLKERFDAYLIEHGAMVKIREGYGATECVTASCLNPINIQRKGSVGIPFPDTYYKICKAGTNEQVPYGIEGEICICGPTLMKGYLNSPEETKKVLKLHDDGHTWLHTGDAGVMDEDGFVYFKRRLRRMIVTSGYNVYPEQLENLLDSHPKVCRSCVVGIDDPHKMRRIKAYVIPEEKAESEDGLISELRDFCTQNVARYAVPAEFAVISKFPLTKYGKIAYGELEGY